MEPNITYPLNSRSRAPFCVRPSISKIWRHHCTLGEKHVCEFSPPSHCTSAHPRKSSLLQCFKIAYFDVVFILYIHIISSMFGQFLAIPESIICFILARLDISVVLPGTPCYSARRQLPSEDLLWLYQTYSCDTRWCLDCTLL